MGLYITVILGEYLGWIPHIPRYQFDPGFYGNASVTLHNAATVVLIFLFAAFFAAFINRIIRSRETEVVTERDKLITLINNLIDGIILFDHTGRIEFLNSYAKSILLADTTDKTAITHLFKANVANPTLTPLVDFVNASIERPYATKEITLQYNTEHTILQVTVVRIAEERHQMGSLVILHNITREKDLDEIKSDFISVAAHQLRTPLSTLKWLFQLLLDGDAGELTEKQRDLLSKGAARNTEVVEMVNSLLDISEIEEGRFAYQFVPTALEEITAKIVKNSQMAAQHNAITLDYEAQPNLPTVQADHQKITMAIQNLVDNAIKYSQTGGKVRITVKQVDQTLQVAIKDQGIGMSKETQEKIFVKFYRGHEAASKEPTGSGLGLYIVRNIVKRHHGTITYTSELNKGTTFYITLPMHSEE
jgi:signal transduction histidine kinase